MRTSILLTSALAAVTSAASYSNITANAFYSMIPTCARACDVKALTTDGCALNDFACHCSTPEKIGRVIGPCLAAQNNCTTSDLNALATIVGSVCNYTDFNIADSPFFSHGSNSSSGSSYGSSYSGSSSSNSSSTYGVATYTGAASSVKSAGAGMLVVAAAAVLVL